MSILSAVKRLFAAPQIADREALRHFMESRAAYLVQKSITEYTQARANMLFSTLMREKLFIEGYERARWLSYPAAISMVTEMVEGTLRERTASPPGHLDAALQEIEPRVIVSANVGCIQHLQSGTPIPVRHWIELVDDALRAGSGQSLRPQS